MIDEKIEERLLKCSASIGERKLMVAAYQRERKKLVKRLKKIRADWWNKAGVADSRLTEIIDEMEGLK